MMVRRSFFAVVFVLVSVSAHAGYALPAPPQGFSVTAQGFMYRAPAGMAAVNQAFATGVSVNVGGKAVTMPATLRMAANAGQFAASAMRFNPAWFVGTAALTWAISEGFWIGDDGDWRTLDTAGWAPDWDRPGFRNLSTSDKCNGSYGVGTIYDSGWTGNGYTGAQYRFFPGSHSTASADGLAYFGGGNCPGDATTNARNAALCYSPVQGVVKECTGVSGPGERAPTESEWTGFGSKVWPDAALDVVSEHAPMPVQAPEMSPVTEPLGSPYLDPITGQPYRDMVRITPSPTPEAPFRQRVDPYREPMDSAEPDAEPIAGPKEKVDLPPEQEEQTQLCEDFPEISACQELGEPEEFELDSSNRDVNWQQELSASGVCPAPMMFTAMGHQMALSWEPACTYAAGIRPFVVGIAWLSAGIWLFGLMRSNT